MADPVALLHRYRSKGVLLDSNLLVLYLIGRVNSERIANFKRTQKYSAGDFDLLHKVVGWCGGLAATPHILSQASDLAVPGGAEFARVRQQFRAVVQEMQERFETSRVLTAHALFDRLGLADAAIATECDHGSLVLTDDLELQLSIEARGGAVLNFSHLREMAW